MPVISPEEESEFGHPVEDELGEQGQENDLDSILNHFERSEPAQGHSADRAEKKKPAEPTEEFKDATPEYVTKQPDQVAGHAPAASPDFPQNNPNQVVGPSTPKLDTRITGDQAVGRMHAPPLPNPANAAAHTATQTAGKAAAQGAKQAGKAAAGKVANEIPIGSQVVTALGDMSEIKNAEGFKGKAKAIKGAAEDVAATVAEGAIDATGVGAVVMAGLNLVLTKEDKRDIIAAAGGNPFKTGAAIGRILKRHYKLILYPALTGAVISLFMGLALGAMFSRLFGNSAGAIGLPGAGTYISTGANPNGLYLDIMTDSLSIVDPTTKRVKTTLTIEATSGKYSDETSAKMATAANAAGVTGDDGRSIVGRACLFKDGHWRDENSGNDRDATDHVDCLSMNNVYNAATNTSRPFTDDELQWYAVARWPYVKTYWPQTNKPSTVANADQPFKYFQGVDVVLYNPLTNKAVHLKAADWGPSVVTGIPKSDLGKVKTSWLYGPFGVQPRIQIPQDYEGRVAGGPPNVMAALGEGDNGPVIVGYLKPGLNLPLGPISADTFHVIARGTDATTAQAGKVPLIKQGDFAKYLYTSTGDPKQTIARTGCGIVSAAMVLMSYGKTVNVPELAAWSVSHGYRTSNEGTAHGFFPAIAQREGLKTQELTGKWDQIISLLKAGTPVIISGQDPAGTADPRPFVNDPSSHFVVMTGITADGRITVNDPARGPKGSASRDGQAYAQDVIKNHYHYAVAILK